MKWVLAAVFLLHAALSQATAATSENHSVQLLTGDGQLSVGTDLRGRITGLRWPSPEQWEHVGATGDAEYDPHNSPPGAGWMLRDGQHWRSLAVSEWTVQSGYQAPDSLVIVTRFDERGTGRSALQHVYVWPGEDVLVVHLRLRGFEPQTRIAWYQNFAPSTHHVTGFPAPLPAAGTHRDFAAWYDADRAVLTHFRPRAPGRAMWARSRSLVRNPQRPAAWDQFGEGVYLSTVSPNRVVAAAVAEVGASMEVPGAQAAAGQVCALLELAPEVDGDELVVAAVLGIARTSVEARTTAGAAHLAGLTAVAQAADAGPAAWLQVPRGIPVAGGIERDILNLLLCVDQATGGVLRAPAASPPQAYATVFDAAWVSAALDTLGYTGAAGRALQRHLDSVRMNSTDGYPVGSLPAAIYATGVPARFDGAADPASAAWLIAACWRYAIHRPGEEGTAYLDGVWPILASCADYLAREPRVGRVLGSGADAPDVSLTVLDTHYLGLESARRCAEFLGIMETEMVVDRRSELYARIRFRRLNDSTPQTAADPWIARWLETLGDLGGTQARWDVLLDVPGIDRAGDAADGQTMPGSDIPSPVALREALRCLDRARQTQ